MKQSHNIALILAGGTGERMHASVPKQFMEIDGESVILHTMKAFQQHPLIHEIYLVCTSEWEGFARREAERGGISKLSGIIRAGESSFASEKSKQILMPLFSFTMQCDPLLHKTSSAET